MSDIYLINLFAVGIFGMILSVAFCDIQWTRKKTLFMAGGMTVIFIFQGIVYFGIASDIVAYIYPFLMHLPLIVLLSILSRKYLWSAIAVMIAYLCCQIRRWLALLIVAIFAGDSVMQDTIELFVTLPILLLILRLAAPSVRAFSHSAKSVQLQLGLVPALYYGFDYLTRIYTDLLLQGGPGGCGIYAFCVQRGIYHICGSCLQGGTDTHPYGTDTANLESSGNAGNP